MYSWISVCMCVFRVLFVYFREPFCRAHVENPILEKDLPKSVLSKYFYLIFKTSSSYNITQSKKDSYFQQCLNMTVAQSIFR